MTTANPLLSRKQQVLGQCETSQGTAETLRANDGIARIIVGAAAEYNAPREKRDLARKSLTPIGNLESTKAVNVSFRSEVNTPDTFSKVATAQIDAIAYDSGNIVKVTFDSGVDLSEVNYGEYLTINYCSLTVHNGTHKIYDVDDSSHFLYVVNRNVTNNSTNISGSDIAKGDVQTNLDYGWALEACSCKLLGAMRIPIGAITVSSFQRNETITGGVSGATGRVLKAEVNGAAYLYFEPTSATPFDGSEEVTGGTSGAKATMTDDPAVYGYHVKPVSENQEMATLALQQDGFEFKARSAMGNFTLEAQANRAGFLDFAFQGPRQSIGDVAMLDVTRDNEDPPILKNAELTLGGSFTPVFKNFAMDCGNEVILRENGNATGDTGYETARIVARESKVTINCEHELAATYDFFGTLDAGTKTSLSLHLGGTVGKQFYYFADELEFDALPIEDQDGIVGLALSAMCTGDLGNTGDDDDWEMLFI